MKTPSSALSRAFGFLTAAMLIVAAVAMPARAQKALVYCPAGTDATGCTNTVNALAPIFPDGVDRGFDGSSGTINLRTADLWSYSVLVIPSLATTHGATPYSVLADTAIGTRLKNVILGKVALWSGTPDQGSPNGTAKDTLIQNLARFARENYAQTRGPGLVVLQDLSDSAATRYSWLERILGTRIVADTNLASYSSVDGITATGKALLLRPNQLPISYANMASFGFIAPSAASGFTVDAIGRTGTAQIGQNVLLTSTGGNNGGAIITSDKDDYAPGTVVTLTGSGFAPGETVHIVLAETPYFDTHPAITVVADGSGSFMDQSFSPDEHDVDIRFIVTATGATSGIRAVTTFTDGTSLNSSSLTFGAQSPASVTPGSSAAVNVSVKFNGNGSCAIQLTTSGLPSGASSSFSPANLTGTSTQTLTSTLTISTTAAILSGKWPYNITATGTGAAGADCTPSNTSFTVKDTLVVGSLVTANGSVSSTPTNSTYGQSVTFKVDFLPKDATGYVQFQDNGVILGTSQQIIAGSASVTSSSLSVGTHLITVVYTPGPGYAAGALTGATLQVSKAAATVTLGGLSQTYTGSALSATATTNPTGLLVDFKYDGASQPPTNAGSYTVVGTINDANYQGSSSGTLVIAKANQAALTIANTVAQAPYGQSFTVTPGGGTGTGAYSVSTAGACSNTGNKVTMTSGTGTCTIKVDRAGDGNYNAATQISTTVAAQAATLTPSILAQSKTYDGTMTATVTGSFASGIIGSDAVTLGIGAATFSDKNVGTGKTVTATGLTLGGTGAANYVLSSTTATTTANITAAPATVVASSPSDIVYGSAAPTVTSSVSGLVGGDPASVVTGLSCGTTYTAGSPVGQYATACSGGSATNYSLSYTAGSFQVTKAPLSVTAANASRVYGEANPTFTGSLTGVYGADGITATYASAATAQSDVGTYPITAKLADPNGKLTNYTVSNTAGQLTVTKASLTIAAANASRTYGDANGTFTGTITGLKNSDGITATYSTSADASSPVGTYNIVPAAVDATPAKLGNYNVTLTNGMLTIGAAALTVTPANASRLYGASNPTFSGTITGIKNSDNITASYASAATSTSPVGSYDITATLNDQTNKLGNYTVTLNKGTLTVGKAPLAVTTDASTKVYGEANPGFSVSYGGFVNSETSAVLGGTLAFTTAATTGSDVGSYPVTPSGLTSSNYDITFQSGTLTITRAAITVAANDKTRTYGASNPTLDGTLAGVKNSDPITASYSTSAIATSGVGDYAIVPALADPSNRLGNYTVTSTNGKLTITKAQLTVTPDAQSKVYGATLPSLTGQITGFANGETGTVLTTQPTYATTATDHSVVGGTYSITASGAAAANYDFTYNSAALTVTPAPLSITANDASKTYGAANPAFSVAYSGFVLGETATALGGTLAVTTAADQTTGVGTYPIVPSGLASTNYAITFHNGTLTIGKAALTIAAASTHRTYGDANPTFSGTLTGLQNGDAITATYTSAAAPASAVGTYDIVPTAVDANPSRLGNYSVTFTNGTLTVDPAQLTVTTNAQTRVYGDANPSLTGSLTGIKNSDNITASYSTTAVPGSAIGQYPITAALADPDHKLGNYAVTNAGNTLTVTKATLTVTPTDASRLYGATNPAFTGTIDGIKNSDAITASYSTTATNTTPVGTATITATLSDPNTRLGNYDVTLKTGTLTINKAPLTVTTNPGAKVYGTANPSFSVSYSGFVNNETSSVLGGTLAFTTTATQASDVGGYHVTPSGLTSGNYDIGFVDGILTVTPAPLGVSANNKSREYGASDPTFDGTLTGVTNGDQITATYAPASTVASPVGTYTITPTLVDPNHRLPNYSVASTNGTLTITQAPLSVITDAKTKVYGDANPAFTGNITGIRNNDNITATFTSVADPTSPVGSVAITATLADPGDKLGNYAVTNAGNTLTITPAPLTITAGDNTRLYGDVNPTLTGTVQGLKNGDGITATYSTQAVATSPVGPYPIVPTAVDASPAKLGNYTVSLVNGTLTVNPAQLTVTVANQSRTYGDANPTLTGNVAGIKNGDAIVATYNTTATETSRVGTYQITASVSGTALTNYTVANTPGTLTVTQAPLTIKADNATRVYGDANPIFSGTITGVKNNDPVTPSYTTAATQASAVGSYDIVPHAVSANALTLTNYAITLTNGTLQVTPAALAVTTDAKSRVYGDANPPLTGGIGGIKNGDNITATYSTTALVGSPVGGYPITATLADPDHKLANYTVTNPGNTLTVTVAPLSVTPANASRIYGDANPPFAGNVTGVKNNDNITASYSTTADPTASVGTYDITATLSDPDHKLTNYQLTQNKGTLTITPAALTITAAGKSRTYGDANPTLAGSISGLKNGDGITATYSTAANETSPVGTYAIVPAAVDASPAKLSNYTVSLVNGTLTVNKATLAVKADDKSRLYGDDNPALTGTVTGTKNNETITASYTTAADKASPVGQYAIAPDVAGSTLSNYDITRTPGTLTIGQAPLTIAAASAERIYGDANPPLTGNITGLKNGDGITATYASSANAASAVGAYDIVPTPVDASPAKLANYAVTLTNGKLTVKPAALTVTTDAKTKVYGDANPPLTGGIDGIKNGDNITASYSTTAVVGSSVGSYPITTTLVDPGQKLGNYTVTNAGSMLTVTRAALTVTPADASRPYGAANPVFTGTVDGIKNGDAITATYSSTATSTTPVGTAPITASLGDPGSRLSNYDVTLKTGTLTIGKAPLTVTTNASTKVYGTENPPFTVSYSGFVNGETSTVLGGTLGFTTTATAASGVGGYPVTPGGLTAGNYAITFADGTLTITPAAISVKANDKSKVYGDADPALDFTITSGALVNGDNFTGALARVSGEKVANSPYAIQQGTLALSANYTMTFAPANLAITRRPLATQSVTVSDKIYDGSTSATITGRQLAPGKVANDDVSLAGGTATFLDKNVGSGKQVNITGLALTGVDAGNYSLPVTTATATASIAQRPITVTATPISKTYGDGDPALTYAITAGSMVSGESLTGALTRKSGETVTGGPYPIDLGSLTAGGNYIITYVGANFTITPKAASVTPNANGKNYGLPDPSPLTTGTLSGFLASDNVTATYSRVPGESAGSYTISATLSPSSVLSNYNITYGTAQFTIRSWWTFGGFYQPVTMQGTSPTTVWNSVKSGSTVPLKFQVFAGATELTDPARVMNIRAVAVACQVGQEVQPQDFVVDSTGGTQLRYTGGQFVFNWQTPKAPGACYELQLTTMDGSILKASFKLK